MRTSGAVLLAAFVTLTLLYGATFYAIDKSRQRTDCYRAGHSECGRQNMIERAVAWLLA